MGVLLFDWEYCPDVPLIRLLSLPFWENAHICPYSAY